VIDVVDPRELQQHDGVVLVMEKKHFGGALGFGETLDHMEEEGAARVWWAGVRPALGRLGLRLGQP